MNAKDAFITRVNALKGSPYARYLNEGRRVAANKASKRYKGKRSIALFIQGWDIGLRSGFRSSVSRQEKLGYEAAKEWVRDNDPPATPQYATVVLQHENGTTRYAVLLDDKAITHFVKRLKRLPHKRFE